MSRHAVGKPGQRMLLGVIALCPTRRSGRTAGTEYDLDSGGGAAR